MDKPIDNNIFYYKNYASINIVQKMIFLTHKDDFTHGKSIGFLEVF